MKEHYSLDDFGVTLKQETLKNGLKVGFVEKPYSPIYAKILIRAGSIFDPVGKEGIAHFTEHMIVSGSKTHSKEAFSGLIESIGGYWNASTSEEVMTVKCEVATKEHMKNMKQYFTEALSSIHITEEGLENEKNIIISEIEQERSDPSYQAYLHIGPIFANGTRWRTPTLGSINSVSSFTIEDVENFFSTYCTVENMVLMISGGCTWNEVVETFETIPLLHSTVHTLPSDPTYLPDNAKIIYEQDIPQTNVEILFKAPPVHSRESYMLNFALQYAHDGITSRFYKKIRNEKALAYSLSFINVIFNKMKYTGTAVGVPTKKVDETITAIKECYQELLEEGITQKQIDEKIDTMWFSALREKERSRDWVSTFGYEILYPEESPIYGLFPDGYNYRRTYTAEEINKVLKKYITLDSYYLVVNGIDAEKYK